MKKKILAALACAAVLSLAGCAGNETSALMDIASKAANENASKPANSTPTQNNGGTSSKTTSTPTSTASAPTSSKTNGTSSAPTESKEDPNAKLFRSYTQTTKSGEKYVEIAGYSGVNGEVVIPSEINGVEVKIIGPGAFENNIDITSITIPASVTSIRERAFNQCLNLNEVTFMGEAPHMFDNVTDYSDALNIFEGTPWLENKKKENSKFLIINNVLVTYFECEGDITIPDGITRIAPLALKGNQEITSVTFPDSVTEIGTGAFNDCRKLNSINIPASLTKIGNWVFSYCPIKGRITIPDSVEFYVNSFPLRELELVYKGKVYSSKNADELKTDLEQYAIENEFGDKDCVITDNVLMNVRPGVTKLELPDTVKGIDDNAFKNCDKSIIITFKGKNYNLANLDKLKADVSGNTAP